MVADVGVVGDICCSDEPRFLEAGDILLADDDDDGVRGEMKVVDDDRANGGC